MTSTQEPPETTDTPSAPKAVRPRSAPISSVTDTPSAREAVSFSDIAAGLPETRVRPETEFSEIVKKLRPIRAPSFQELAGTRLASLVLVIICGLAMVFLGTWWFTRPSLAEVQALMGTSVSGKEVLEALRSLRTEHFNELRDLFQLIVLSGLVPLFTLLAGYAFGSRQRERDQ